MSLCLCHLHWTRASADESLRMLQLKEIAPEYYETLAFHKSWTWVTWKFLSDPDVGPWTRMRRPSREPVTTPATPDKAAALVRLPCPHILA